jgi:hypothetical protein
VFQSLPFDFEIAPDQSLPQNFQSTDTFRFGADYRLGTSSNIRIGYLSHNAAAPDETVTPNLPEASRSEFTASAPRSPSISISTWLTSTRSGRPRRAQHAGRHAEQRAVRVPRPSARPFPTLNPGAEP